MGDPDMDVKAIAPPGFPVCKQHLFLLTASANCGIIQLIRHAVVSLKTGLEITVDEAGSRAKRILLKEENSEIQ
jgi:hypothetical protein